MNESKQPNLSSWEIPADNEHVVQFLSGNKIDGIPIICPPIKKLSAPLDVVVVHKDLSITSLGDPLKAMQLMNVQGHRRGAQEAH